MLKIKFNCDTIVITNKVFSMRDKKFPKKSLAVAIICVLLFIALIVIYATMAHSGERYVLAILGVGVLLFPIMIAVLYNSIKNCLSYSKYKKVIQNGTDGTCNIFDCQIRRANGKQWLSYYSLILHYVDDGIEKSFTTGYDYIKEEYEYLYKRKNIKCRFLDGLLIVTEAIPKNVYKNLTPIGKVNSKFLRGFIRAWYIISAISVAVIIAAVAVTVITEGTLFLIISISCVFGVNLICAIIFAICFFMGKV